MERSVEILNLGQHGLTAAPGKGIVINGVTYVLQQLLDVGGEAYVFPVANLQSGLALFVVKIYRFRPGSAEYEALKEGAPRDFHIDCYGIPVLHTERYETSGCMVRFQRFLGSIHEAAYLPADMEAASAFIDERAYSEAVRTYYDAILTKNPAHTHAMANSRVFCGPG